MSVLTTFVRAAPEVIDAEIAYANGGTDTLTGTPNHPFWVDAVRDYVPLGELEVGTVLHVQGGGEAILVSKTWRQGEFEVFDFEVEGLHNFYVRGSGSDAAGVLVHNSTGGTATFKHRPSGGNNHVSVEIKDSTGSSLGEFHQTIDGKTTGVGPVGSDVAGVKGTYSVDLPNPQGAVDEAKALESFGDMGKWDKGTNSCIHAACNIANAGGAGLPTTPQGQTSHIYDKLIDK